MLTIQVDGYQIDLSALEDVLSSTGVDRALLNRFSKELLLSNSERANPIWEDVAFKAQVIERLGQSIPSKMTSTELPTLPDQLSLLLRSEMTLVSENYALTLDERDRGEQLLQDLIRPIIYHVIERFYAKKPNAQPAALVASAISQTITTNWQASNAGKWEIRPLDSLIGPIGYEFRTTNEVVYSDCPMTAEGAFFNSLTISLAEKICSIHLE
ncbi:MAG: hypothetical protein AB8G95_29875 [Anaerolineae bacterium]